MLLAPTSAYSVSISINDTEKRTVTDLSGSTTVNLTDLTLGTHHVKAAFKSIDKNRQISRDQRIRVMGVKLGWEGSVNIPQKKAKNTLSYTKRD